MPTSTQLGLVIALQTLSALTLAGPVDLMAQAGANTIQLYPEGADIPRGLTEAERAFLLRHPLVPPPMTLNGAPTGPVHCVAEYEPMEALLVAWEGSSSWLNILKNMAVEITHAGDADLHVAVDTPAEQASAASSLAAAGADMNRVHFVVRTTDTIWIRDYGPRYIYEGDCRAIVDHTYNRPRPNDNAFPAYFAQLKGHARYSIPLIHGGGNYHLDALGRSHTTRLIVNENPGLTEPQIHDLWQTFQNVDTTFYTPFPTSIDATQHIDMWMQIIADDVALISDWPFNAGSTQDQICDAAAADLAARGYAVYRTPARSVGGTHYTYTNAVMCNGIVLIPFYTNASVQQHNGEARAAWQAAAPDKTIIQLDTQAIVSAAGVMHCIVMHMPVHRGGESPTAYLRAPNGGAQYLPGEEVEIQWISDDDRAVVNVDILLSLDGGATFDTALAREIEPDGAFLWTIPDLYAAEARIRVVARDVDGNTGHDDSDTDFLIDGARGPLGDLNCDAAFDGADIEPFFLALGDPPAYASAYPDCDRLLADMNADGEVNGADVDPFFACLGGENCP